MDLAMTPPMTITRWVRDCGHFSLCDRSREASQTVRALTARSKGSALTHWIWRHCCIGVFSIVSGPCQPPDFGDMQQRKMSHLNQAIRTPDLISAATPFRDVLLEIDRRSTF